MYARTTLLEIDTMRVSVDAAVKLFEEAVLPQLRQQPGFRGVYVLSTPDGQGMLLSFWETAETAETNSTTGWYPEILSQFATLFRSPPGRERYEVRVALPPVGEELMQAGSP